MNIKIGQRLIARGKGVCGTDTKYEIIVDAITDKGITARYTYLGPSDFVSTKGLSGSFPWNQYTFEEDISRKYTDSQVNQALSSWLHYGRVSDRMANNDHKGCHSGYYGQGGWAYEVLAWHLGQREGRPQA